MALQVVYETHSTTLDNERGIATGWLPGELSATGRRNAADLGRRRRDDGIDLVVTSDLARALETCAIAFDGAGIEVRTDMRLRECNYGELNGAPVEAVDAQRPARLDRPFPGGQSYREVTGGLRDLLGELHREHDGQRVLLVGHAATRFGLDHLFTGRPLEAALTSPFAWREGWEYRMTGTWPEPAVLGGATALDVQDELVAVYRAAFTAPPYSEDEDAVAHFAAESLPAHAARKGFRCATLRIDSRLAGFAYGYTGERGQWWSDQVAQRAPADLVAEWLDGHLEVVELAVDPAVQHRGYATALHDLLLQGALHDRALLSTWVDDLPAPRMYRRLGWQLLHPRIFDDSDLWGLDLRRRRLRG